MNGLTITWVVSARRVGGAAGILPLALLVGLSGCTQMTTIPPPPDTGPVPDAGMDAMTPDGGVFPPPVIETCTPEGMGSTLGEACTTDGSCDDGCYCNGTERCEAGACVAGAEPCADEVECTADVCLEEANRCFHEPQHEMCGNGDACDGIELCDLANGCGPGAPPYCNDESSCTVDSCDPAMGCVFQARDLDGDGFDDGRCGGEDCDDDPRFGTDIFPGAPELCTNRRDDDCDGMRDYTDDECLPTNDTCESAVVIPGPGTYSGSTRALASDFTLACRSGGPDAVFRFTLAETQDVTLTVSGGGSGAGVSLRPWAQCASGPDDKCNDGSPPSLLRRSLPAGEYAILVQSSGSGAAFDLNVRFGPPTEVPLIDVCNAETEDLCGGAPCTTVTRTLSGLFADVQDDYETSCSFSGSWSDAVYRFTIDTPKDVTIRGAAGWSTFVALTTDCNTESAEIRCHSGNPGEVRQRELAPGTYYVIVETSNASASGFSLDVSITDPLPRVPGDACSSALDISEATLGGGGMGSVLVSALELDSGTSCGGTETWFGDATFRFTLPETRDVTLTTTTDDFSWNNYFVSLRPTCGDRTTELRCWSGNGPLGQSWRSLPAGEYFVTISTQSSSGDVTAALETRPPTPIPPNDQCGGAIPLTSGAITSGSTIGFEDNAAGGSCASGSKPDAFYTFTLAERSDVVISVRDSDASATTSFWLTLRRDTCGTGAQAACGASSGTPPSTTINATLDPGTYFLQVESDSTDTSDFRITPVFFPVP